MQSIVFAFIRFNNRTNIDASVLVSHVVVLVRVAIHFVLGSNVCARFAFRAAASGVCVCAVRLTSV